MAVPSGNPRRPSAESPAQPEPASDSALLPRPRRTRRRLTAALPLIVLLAAMIAGFLRPAWGQAARTNSPASPAPRYPHLPEVSRPAAQQPPVGTAEDRHLDKTPPRATKGLDLVKMGWTYNCMECHAIIPARWHYDRPMVEHQDIRLDHGNNRFCLNCHHPTRRNAFVDYDGAEIPQAEVVSLCAKCHGTIHRDWKAGVHGRLNGFWNAELGPKTRLRCIQCHDPHQPAFPSMKPLPPPRYPARAAHPPGGESPPAHAAGTPAGQP